MDSLISFNQEVLRSVWPLDLGCTCQAMGFFTILVNVILVAVVFYLLRKIPSSRLEYFFPLLGVGFLTLLVSEVIDWWQSILVSRAGYLVFYPPIYSVQEVLRIAGFALIFFAMFKIQKRYS